MKFARILVLALAAFLFTAPALADLQLAPPYLTILDSNGDPVSGAKLYAYESGTTTALDTYSDEDLTTANANPVIADSAGRFGPIWLKSQDYKLVIKDSSDVTIKTIDPVKGSITVSGDSFKVGQQSPADMTVSVGAGTFFNQATKAIVSKTAQTSSSVTAPTTNPRYDIVYIDRLDGTVGIQTGTEAASPSDPTIPDGKLPLARISLATSTTEITDAEITDIRELVNLGWVNVDGGLSLVSTDADAAAEPVLDLQRDSATPADNDYLGEVLFSGEDDGGAKTSYSAIVSRATDVTNGTEDGEIHFQNNRGGAGLGTKVVIGSGLYTGSATGGDQGLDTINASGIYVDGVAVSTATDTIQILDNDPTANQVVNTTSETALYSYSVPANTLGTTKALRVQVRGTLLNTSGGGATYTFRIKYGATTIFDDVTGSYSSGAAEVPFSIEFYLVAVDSTSAQRMNGMIAVGSASSATAGVGNLGGNNLGVNGSWVSGTAAEDSTGALTLSVTVQMSVADATTYAEASTRMVELLP